MHLSTSVASIIVASFAVASLAACTDEPPIDPPPPPDPVNWYRDVGPIVAEHCMECHRAGGLAPFSLTTYRDAAERAGAMLDAVSRGAMPPWDAVAAPDCTPTRGWRRDPTLSPSQVDTLRAWIAAQLPEGEARTLPEPPSAGLVGRTHHLIPNEGFATTGFADQFMCYVFDPQLVQPMFVEGWNVVPGNGGVVHHAVVAPIAPAELEGYRMRGELGKPVGCTSMTMSGIGAWAPGQAPMDAPTGVGLELAAGTGILMQVHYHPGGRDNDPDLSSIELRLTPVRPPRVFRMGGFAGVLQPGPNDRSEVPEFRIPADAVGHTERFVIQIDDPNNAKRRTPLFLVQPHEHYIGTRFEMRIHRATPPPGEPVDECLINANWEFDWQRTYQYDVPVEQLPTYGHGDTIEVTCTYDNSRANPYVQRLMTEFHLPGPVDINGGGASYEEMCLGIIGEIADS